MNIYYLRLENRVVPGLNPAIHNQWEDIRPVIEQQCQSGRRPIILLAEGNGLELACQNVIYSGSSKEFHIYAPPNKKWVIFPVHPSILFKEAILRAVPIKVFLTRYYKGKLTPDWRLAVVLIRKKPVPLYKMKGEILNLGPAAFNDMRFMDGEKLTAILIESIGVSKPLKQKRQYRKIMGAEAETLPLPTKIPD